MKKLLLPFLLLLCGCPMGLGDRCDDNTDCAAPLLCSPVSDTGSAGLCDYALRVEGEPCSQAAECEGPLTCSNHFTAGERYGQCVAPRAAGQGCLIGRDCVSEVCAGATEDALGVCE